MPQKEEKSMATATLSASLTAPLSEHRLTAMERILVIEDDGASRRTLRKLLSSEGYEVDVASDAAHGLERLRKEAPAAVLLGLPRLGSSGWDICKKVANLIPRLPLVILGESSDVADKV